LWKISSKFKEKEFFLNKDNLNLKPNFFSFKDIKKTLQENHIFLTKKYGQNFLMDKNKIQQIIKLADLGPEDSILEIGPGMGALTHQILPIVKNLDVVEIDKGLIRLLQTFFGSSPNCHIYHEDILKFDFDKLQADKIKIISNLPYNIASQIFFKIMDIYDIIEFLVVMLPEELANKLQMTPGNKKYGLFTIFFQTFFLIAEKPIVVSPSLFFPKPKVSSKVLKIFKQEKPNLPFSEASGFVKFLSFIFQNRRKKFYSTILKILKKEKVDFLFTKYKLEENIRPEDIEVFLFEIFYKEVKIIKKNFDKV